MKKSSIKDSLGFCPVENVVSMAPLNILESQNKFILRSRAYLSTPSGYEIPSIICYPEKFSHDKTYPAVICLTGSGGSKEDLLDCIPVLPFLAKNGFIAATLDRPYQGERHLRDKSFDDFIDDALCDGSYIHFFSQCLGDIEILYQYLKEMNCIGKIGVIGASNGGFESYVFASIQSNINAIAIISGIIDWEVMYNTETEAWKCLVFPDSKIYWKVKKCEKETGGILVACHRCLDTWLNDYKIWIPLLNEIPIHFSAGENDPLCLITSIKKAYDLAKQRKENETVTLSIEKRSHNITLETLENVLDFLIKYLT